MKLLFAIKQLSNAPGGAERVLCTVCSSLAAKGHDVSIVSFDSPGGRPFYELHASVKRIHLDIGLSHKPAGFIETLKRMKALRRKILLEKPDIAVGFMHSMFIPLALSLVGTGIPSVGSEHIVSEHYKTRRLEFFFYSRHQIFKKITVLSAEIRSAYPSSVRVKMQVVPNPVCTPLIESNKLISGYNRVLLNVGRLENQKDQATLIKAFAKIESEFPDWKLKIIGNGPLKNSLQRLVQDLGLSEKVSLPGVTSDINSEYIAADIFVTSSLYEAFGLATAEAMSFSLPVVGFADCPGTNELVEHNLTGILVNPKKDRAGELAAALHNLIGNPVLQNKLGVAAKESIERNFSSDQVCLQWEKLLISTMKEEA